jgi:acyl-CoA thioester hydrolase
MSSEFEFLKSKKSIINSENGIIISNRYPIRVRYVDTDRMGFVYNGNYLAFFEVGRTELMRSFGLVYTKLEQDGYQLPLIESYVRYHNAALYDDVLEIEAILQLNSIGSKLRFDYNVFRTNDLIASGFTAHMFMKVETQRAVRAPEAFMSGINQLKNKFLNNEI